VTPLDHDGLDPLYMQLAAVLRERIASGDLGRRVPSVVTLAQQYEVSQGTAERALRILKDEGLIKSAMGRGTFVVGPDDRKA
jgi:DNA-binding GntR family transcriptional regulator